MNSASPAQVAIDPGALRACLCRFATGVTVMTCFADGASQGVTANSFSSVSMDPPLVQWSIGRFARSFGAFTAAEGFAVNILAEGQAPLSTRFASKAKPGWTGSGPPTGFRCRAICWPAWNAGSTTGSTRATM